jgi:hypothetical protein
MHPYPQVPVRVGVTDEEPVVDRTGGQHHLAEVVRGFE